MLHEERMCIVLYFFIFVMLDQFLVILLSCNDEKIIMSWCIVLYNFSFVLVEMIFITIPKSKKYLLIMDKIPCRSW